MKDISYASYSSGAERAEAASAFFRRVYHWMAAGLILTAVAAQWVASDASLFQAAVQSWILLVLVELGLVLGLSWGINRISAAVAMVMFVAYSLVNGVTLSAVLWVYTQESVFTAFLTAAGMFGAMSVYGLYTKRDLTEIRSFLMMGLIGLIVAGLINLFVGSGIADLVISAVGVVVFMGLTAYDTQYLRNLGGEAEFNGEAAQKLAVVGALKLYLDFINLFLYLLRFFGKRRD